MWKILFSLKQNLVWSVPAFMIAGIIFGALTDASFLNDLSNSSSQVVATTNTSSDAQTQQAMIEAINDEYHARAFYNAVIDKFGEIRPFSNIVHAETRHAERLSQLFKRYGLTVPQDSFAGKVEAPETLEIACQMGVAAEIANVKMYDRFLDLSKERLKRHLYPTALCFPKQAQSSV